MSRASWLRWFLGATLVAGVVVLALPDPEAPPVEAVETVEAAPLAVQWGHCAVARHAEELLCVYDPADPIRLWIDHPRAADAQVRLDGVEVSAEVYTLEEEVRGQGRRVSVPAGARELAVLLPDGSSTAWRVRLRDAVQHDAEVGPFPPTLVEAYEQGLMGSGDEAKILDASERLVEHFVSQGEVGWAVDILIAASVQLRSLRSFEPADRALDRAEALDAGAKGRGTVATYRGLLRWSQGRLRDAAALLRDGARYSLRVEEPLGTDAVPIYAEALAELGYYAEARHWARRAPSLTPLPCDRAAVMRTVGWINLLLRARDQPHDDPRPLLREAIGLFRGEDECEHTESGAWLSLALLAMEDGEVPTAGSLRDEIDLEQLSDEDRVRVADLDVRLSLAKGQEPTATRRAWESLVRRADVVDDDDARWRVEVRRGQLLLAEGDDAGAIAALTAAERRLDRLVRAQAVVGVGRTAAADRYLEGTMTLVSRLVERGEVARALCVAREARARRRSAAAGLDVLSPESRARVEEQIRQHREHKRLAELTLALIDQRPRGEAAGLRYEAAEHAAAANDAIDAIVTALGEASRSPRCDELPAPAPGELLVDLYPRTGDWLLMVQDERSTRATTVPTPSADALRDPESLGPWLLDPLSAELDAASRVRVLAHREAQQIDVHALPWRGRPLLAQHPISYGVELPALAPAPLADPPRALLVADPTDTLTFAAREVEQVDAQLRGVGWSTDVPVTADTEPGAAELGFEGYALFHYAAHTAGPDSSVSRVWAPYPAGEAGDLPHLQVGRTARLEVHDILALRPVPPLSFLAGCRTGVVELDAGSTSLALAFLLADGHQVVASRDDVDDAQAVEVATRFYEALAASPARDPAMAMHRVQQQQSASEQVVPYRVWVR